MSCKISKDLVGELVTSPVLMRRLKMILKIYLSSKRR